MKVLQFIFSPLVSPTWVQKINSAQIPRMLLTAADEKEKDHDSET